MMLTQTTADLLNALPPGVTLDLASPEDAPALAAFCNRVSREWTGESTVTKQDVQRWLSHPLAIPNEDTVLIRDEADRIVAFAHVANYQPPFVTASLRLRIAPTYAESALQTLLLGWAEDRANETLQDAPPQARVVLRGVLFDGDAVSARRYRTAGFALVRRFAQMGVALSEEPALHRDPPGIVIRPMRPEEVDAAIYADWEAFQDHWGFGAVPFEETAALARRWMATNPFYDPSLVSVAVEGSEVVGLAVALNGTPSDPDCGCIESLAVRPNWRRRGVARALMQHAFGRLHHAGKTRVTLEVDADNPTGAMKLYRSLGMQQLYCIDVYEKELRAGEDLTA